MTATQVVTNSLTNFASPSSSRSPKEAISSLYNACVDDMRALERLLKTHLTHEVELITRVTHHLIMDGGKRLRPLLALACCHAAIPTGPNEKMIELAASIELIHNATLLHDDVIDASTIRRGKPTANALWGNKPSILVGDFLFAKAFELMLSNDDPHVLPILAQVSQTITAGEVLQLSYMETFDLNTDILFNIMHCKTAALFAASTEIGAALFRVSDDIQQSLKNFGYHLGMAFQIVDDVLDYTGNTETLGKKTGDDLAEGKVTLPLFYAYEKGSPSQQNLLKKSLGSTERFHDVYEILHETGALTQCYALARTHADQAVACLNTLPQSIWVDHLTHLAYSLLTRIT